MPITFRDSLLTIVLLSSVLLLVTAVGILLALKFRRHSSRPYLLASFIFLAQTVGILTILSKSIFTGRINAPFEGVLRLEPIISGFLPLFCILAYIAEVKFPGKVNLKNILLFISPALAISAILIPVQQVELYCPRDIFNEMGNFDVWLRLILVSLYLIYPIVIACIPYDWHHCLVSRKMLVGVEAIFFITPLAAIPGLFCGYFPAILVNFILIILLDALVAHIEFKIRIPVPESTRANNSDQKKEQADESILNSPEIWMNPDITAGELAKIMGTNHTYLLDRIKSLGYSSYTDMINRKRVDYICRELANKNDVDIISLMFEAGFRSRSTASREFKRIVGCTPSEYQESVSRTK